LTTESEIKKKPFEIDRKRHFVEPRKASLIKKIID
jgi:hypothetical protein